MSNLVSPAVSENNGASVSVFSSDFAYDNFISLLADFSTFGYFFWCTWETSDF